MAKNSSSNGKVTKEVSPEVQREALALECKRLTRRRDELKVDRTKAWEEFQRVRRLFARDEHISKHDVQAAYKVAAAAEKELVEVEAELTIAKVAYQRVAFPRRIKCGECGEPFTAEMFQRHLEIAKDRGVHCLFYRQ